MQEKNKKTILNIIIIFFIASITAGLFTPVIKFDYSDVLKAHGYENTEWYWTYESTVFYSHRTEYYFGENTNEKPSEYHFYKIFHGMFNIESGRSTAGIVSEYNRGESPFISNIITQMITMTLAVILLFSGVYFIYKGIKLCFIKKNKYFLYLGIMGSIGITSFILASYYYFYFSDNSNLGFINFIQPGYGLYLFCIAIALIFAAYIIQSYYLELPEKQSLWISDIAKFNKFYKKIDNS